MNFSDQQLQCIHARGGPLLVSAAAGSGKTAVLIERILRLLDSGAAELDRMLVVTFTRAAASELRVRLQKGLAELIAKGGENAASLRRQQLMLPRANICTVDALCQKLVSEYRYKLDDLPARMSISQEQCAALLSETLDEVVDGAFAEHPQQTAALATALRHSHKNPALHDALRRMYLFLDSCADPQQWLLRQGSCTGADEQMQRWLQDTAAQMRPRIERLHRACNQTVAAAFVAVQDVLQAESRNKKQRDKQQNELARILSYIEEQRQVLAALCRIDLAHPAEAVDAVQQLSPALQRWTAPSLAAPAHAAVLRTMRERVKALLQQLLQQTVLPDAQDAAVEQHLQLLCTLVMQLRERTWQHKKAQRVATFADIAALALQLLSQRDGQGRLVANEVGEQLSQQFTHVLVDEYQDITEQQDTLFRLLSDNGKNLYMVGDVKQSIYGFRQARPQLFLSRYHDYPDYTDGRTEQARLRLNANYRSRQSVTDAANFICRQIITPGVCGLDYTQEQLHPEAKYPPAPQDACTLLLTRGSSDHSLPEWEARSVADYVVHLLQTRLVAVSSKNPSEGLRPLEPKDICILLRNRTHAPLFQQALAQAGVAATADIKQNFLDTPAVTAVLALLRTVNDPTADIALTATLMSPLFGFSPDDITLLRRTFGQTELYAALHAAASDPSDARLQRLCADFVARLSGWRRLAQTCSAYQLLEQLYDECALPAVLGGQDEQARVWLQRLLDHVHDFDAGGFKGLSAYLRRLDRAGTDAVSAPPQGDGNGVFITVIHQSKGLEYPVVILADTHSLYNRRDNKNALLLHPEQGMALAPMCPDVGAVNHNAGYATVSRALDQDAVAEEIRLLYVALTRAKEHLCISYAARDLDKAFGERAAMLSTDEAISDDALLQANSPASLLLAALLRHPDLSALCPLASPLPAQGHWQLVRRENPPAPQRLQQPQQAEPDAAVDEALLGQLQQSAAWRYPYALLSALPAKCAVSKLSERISGSERAPDFICPDFAQTQAMTGAERGTAHHTFMQFADLQNACADLEAEIARQTERGLLSPRQAAALDRQNLQRFFESDLFGRITRADFYHREVPFTFALPAAQYPGADPSVDAGESVVVQGIADAVFGEDGALILLDFKTDRGRTEQQLREHYAPQLQLYARALAEIYGMPVRQALLFSFEMGKTVEVPL